MCFTRSRSLNQPRCCRFSARLQSNLQWLAATADLKLVREFRSVLLNISHPHGHVLESATTSLTTNAASTARRLHSHGQITDLVHRTTSSIRERATATVDVGCWTRCQYPKWSAETGAPRRFCGRKCKCQQATTYRVKRSQSCPFHSAEHSVSCSFHIFFDDAAIYSPW